MGVVTILIWATLIASGWAAELKEPCAEGLPCEASPGTYGVCLGGVCVTEIPAEERRNLSFTIVVKYPEENLAGEDLFLRGNGLGLSWQQGDPLTRISKDTWRKTFLYKTRIDGFLCESCAEETILLSSQKFEYRVLIGDSQDMIGANFALELPISKTALPETPEFQVYPWFNTTTGTATNFTIQSGILNSTTERSIGLYLPPSFYENTYKKYGALLVYDLSPSFVELLQRDVLDKFMAATGIMEETILIGWGDYNVPERVMWLTPVPGTSFDCINGTLENRCNDCYPEGLDAIAWLDAMKNRCGYPYSEGGQGDAGLDFLLQEVLPKAAELTGDRLLSDREHVGIMGYSLGGLMSCYAAWTRSEVLGYAACQSSSFWWPMDPDVQMGFHFLNVTIRDSVLMERRKPQKIYVDVGGVEGGPPYFQDTAAVEATDLMSSTPFFNLDSNLWFQIYPAHPHSSLHWILRVWSPVSVLIPPKGTATRLSTILKGNE